MSKKKKNNPKGEPSPGGDAPLEPGASFGDFALGRPTDPEFETYAAQRDTASGYPVGEATPVPQKRGEDQPKYKAMEWKGFETEEEPEAVPFGQRGPREESEMDMTPMVDVTFLLLIFFMVTASFKLQKAIEQPPDLSEDPSDMVVDPQEQTEAIEIAIDENDNYTISSGESDPEEAIGKTDMWRKVALVRQNSPNSERIVIKANENCTHGAVVNAWDASADAGIAEITISVTAGDD